MHCMYFTYNSGDEGETLKDNSNRKTIKSASFNYRFQQTFLL